MAVTRPLRRCLLAAAATLVGSTPALAMDFARLSTGPHQFVIASKGEILEGDALKLTGFLEAVQGDQLVGYALDSPGGNVVEAEKMATIIHGQATTAGVMEGDTCASACFLLFASAAHRIAAPNALVGVHSVSDGAGNEDDGTLALTTALARDAADYNVPAQIIGELVTTKPGQITWLDVNELTAMGVSFVRPHPAGYDSRDPVTTEAPQPPPALTVATASPAPAAQTATASLPPVMSAAYLAGLGDRKAWESWFGSLGGPAKDGASFWASQRSLPHPVSCENGGGATPSPDWVAGCQKAAELLAPSDVRRRLEPDYRKGWNAL